MTGGWGLLPGLALVNIALFAAYSGVLSVLLPQHVATLAPEDKVASLALITSVSFGFTALAQPLFGALSDRTRSRWGSRLPWMVACAIAGGAALVVMGGVQSIALLVILWAVAQFTLNGTDVAASAYLVDAFPQHRRGRVAAILSVAAIVGGVVGAVVSGQLVASLPVGYAVLAAVVVVAVAVFAVVFRDRRIAVTDAPARVGALEFLRGFWIDPRRHPDFAWVLVWRIVFMLAYGSVHGYLFYLLTDYVNVDESSAAVLVGQVTIVGGAGVVVAALLGGWWSDRIGRRKPFLVAASTIVILANIVPLVAPSVSGIIAVAAALGVALGLALACGLSLASATLPNPTGGAGHGLGVFNLSTNVGQAIAPLVGAAVISTTGGYAALFVVSSALMACAGAVVVAVRGAR